MVDECRIDRVTGSTVDPLTGVDSPTYADPPPYVGKCKVQTFAPYEQTPEVGSSTETVQRYTLHIPVGAGPVRVGDVATVGGRSFRVAATNEKTFQTAQRLFVDEVTA